MRRAGGAARARRRRRAGAKTDRVDALETAYLVLLILTFLVIGWFSVYVVYNLYRGQR